MLHPRYKFPLAYYDIAVIEMDTPVVFSKFIHPICIPFIEEVHESQKMHFQYLINPFKMITQLKSVVLQFLSNVRLGLSKEILFIIIAQGAAKP